VEIAKHDFKWDVSAVANSQRSHSIVEIFASEIADFSKYRHAKAFLRWSRSHSATDLTSDEQASAAKLIALINHALA
jgi:hypothetical protein